MPTDDPQSADALRRIIAEEKARLKPGFAGLEKYREIIQTELEAGGSQRFILKCLRKLKVEVSADTLSRYVRHAGFVKPRRRKRKPSAKPTI